jgi:hypothetical protein
MLSYYCYMDIMTWSCCNTNFWVCPPWYYLNSVISMSIGINAPWSGNLDHQLHNELVIRGLLGTLFHLIPHVYQCFQLIQLEHSTKLIMNKWNLQLNPLLFSSRAYFLQSPTCTRVQIIQLQFLLIMAHIRHMSPWSCLLVRNIVSVMHNSDLLYPLQLVTFFDTIPSSYDVV